MQDPQENQKFSVQEFANAVREKYPAYNGYSDMEIATAFAKKYPEYNSQIDFGEQPSKKKEDTESPFIGKGGSLQFSPSTEKPAPYSFDDKGNVTKYSPENTRIELIRQFRETTGFSKEEASDGVIAYSAAKLYPELKEALGVRTEPVQVNWDEESQKAYSKKRTVVDGDTNPETGEINAFKIIDEGDASDFLSGTHVGKIYNRAIASSEIGKITARSFYGGSIDFEELAYYSNVLDENAGENWMGSFGETAFGGFLADIMRTLPESFISLVDSSLSPEAIASAGTGAAAGSVIPVVGTSVGAAGGAAFAGSGMLTFGSTLMQKLQEAGVDVSDPKQLEAAWNNKELLIPLAKEAAIKGGIVGSFDAISAGLGGTISKSAIKAGAKRTSAEFREYAVEGALGGAGEAFGSLAAGDEVNMRDVALEMVADPAAGISGRGVKAVLGKNADPNEVKILDKIEANKERTLKGINISAVENAEKLGENKTRIEQLQKALEETSDKKTKRLIKKEIDAIQKENTSIHAESLDSLDEFTDEEIEDMSKDADEIVTLARGMQGDNISTEAKNAANQVAENKRKALNDKRKKGGKRRGKKINVSATSKATGAPAEVTETAPDFVQPDAAQGFEEFMDSKEQPITKQDEINEQNDFEQLKSEIPDIDPEEAPTLVQKRKNKDGKDVETYSQTQKKEDGVEETEYYSEIDGEKSTTGGVVFTKEDGFDKLLKAFNIDEKELVGTIGEDADAALLTASETDGKKGKVKLTVKKADGLFEFEIPFVEAAPVESDVKADIEASSQDLKDLGIETTYAENPDDYQQLIDEGWDEIGKTEDGFPMFSRKIKQAPKKKTPKKKAPKKKSTKKAAPEVDDSLSEEGKQAAQALADGMQATVDALKGRDPNTLTEEELQQLENDLSSALGRETTEEALEVPDFDAPPMSAYEEDVMSGMEDMSAEDMAAMEEYFAGESKQRVLGLNYIKQVSDALASSTTKKVDAKLKDTQDKINSSLSKHLKDSLTNAKDFTKFLAENAMQGDFFTVGKALYRVGEVVEEKGKATPVVDVKNFEDLIKFAGVKQSTSVKEALDILYRKISEKTITKQEETLLRQFEAGRYKGVKNKDVSIGDVLTLLDVLRITGKDGDAAMKQAFAMSRDNKVKAELDKILDKYAVVKNGKPVLSKAGFKIFDEANAPAPVKLKYMNLLKKQKQIGKMRKLFAERKKGKFAPIFAKENPMPISEYLTKELGVNTSAGRGGSRTVKFQRYNRKTGEAMPTVSTGKRKEVIGKLKTEFREFKKEQYTATVKDGKLVRKAIKSDRIVDAFGKIGDASYTRFRPEVAEGKAEKQSGARYRRSKETRKTITTGVTTKETKQAVTPEGKVITDPKTGKVKTFEVEKTKRVSVDLIRPKSETSLISALSKVFNLSKEQAEASGMISHRLIKNMARRAGVPVSEIYDKITIAKQSRSSELPLLTRNAKGKQILRPEAVSPVFRRYGLDIGDSNYDGDGNPVNFDILEQKATAAENIIGEGRLRAIRKQKSENAGVYTVAMMDILDGLGLDISKKKGTLEQIIESNNYEIKEALNGAQLALSGFHDSKDIKSEYKGLYRRALLDVAVLNKIEIPEYFTIAEIEQAVGEEAIKEHGRKHRTFEDYMKNQATMINTSQRDVFYHWSRGYKNMYDQYEMGNISLEQFSKGVVLLRTVGRFNYSLVDQNGRPNKKNKLQDRDKGTLQNPTPFVEDAFFDAIESDVKNEHPIVTYYKMLEGRKKDALPSRKIKEYEDGSYWAKFDRTSVGGQESVDALTYCVQETSWCTKYNAAQHLAKGDFYVLFDKQDKGLTAVRMVHYYVKEERGNTPSQTLIPEEQYKLDDFKQNILKDPKSQEKKALSDAIEYYNKNGYNFSKPDESDPAVMVGRTEYLKRDIYYSEISEQPRLMAAMNLRKTKENIIEDEANTVSAIINANALLTDRHSVVPTKENGLIVETTEGVGAGGLKAVVHRVVLPEDTRELVLPPEDSETITRYIIQGKEIVLDKIAFGGKNVEVMLDISKAKANYNVDIKKVITNLSQFESDYPPSVTIKSDNAQNSQKYGDITYVRVFSGKLGIDFYKNTGAVQVVEGSKAHIPFIEFYDDPYMSEFGQEGKSDISDNSARRIHLPQDFDVKNHFGAQIGYNGDVLFQERNSFYAKQDFLNSMLAKGISNIFKTKKDANSYIKSVKEEFPSLKFSVRQHEYVLNPSANYKVGDYYIFAEKNPKYKSDGSKYDDNTVRAAIALADGEAIIYALNNPNVSSPVHEMAHMYEEYLTPKEVKAIEKFAGAKRGTVEFSETFARGFERFLADGKAPTPELKSIFSQFKEWMKSIYKAIVGSPIEKDLTPEVREIFENMVMVEGDVNFRETGFKTGDIVGSLKGKRKLNQEAVKSGMEKLQEVNSNSKKMIAAANSTKDARSIYDKAAKDFGERQRNIEKYMAERGLVLAESTMNDRAGASARAQYKVEAVAKKIYDGLSVKQEDTLNMYLQAERIIQIEKNREEKRNYASEKLREFEAKKQMLLDAIEGKEYSKADKKVIEDSLNKMDGFIKRAQEMLDKNRLYKLDENGIETGELAFKHPNGMTRQDAEAAISQMAQSPDFALIQRRGDLYFDAMSENLKDLYEAGLIDKQTYDRFKNDKYISRAFLGHIFNFETDAEGKVLDAHFEKNANFYEQIGIGGDQIRALAEGSEGELIMNSRYLLEKAYQSASARVLKNEAAQSLAKEMKGKKATWYQDGRYKENKDGIVEDRFGNYTALEQETGFKTVLYKDKGRTRAFYLSDLAYKEWNDLELKIDRSFGMNTARQLSGTSLLKAAATGANPLFFLVNVPMDIGHVLFFTDVYDDNKLLPVNMLKVSKNVSKNIRGIVGLDINKNGNISINNETKNTKRTKELLDIYFLNGGGMDFLTQQGQQLFDEKGNMITKPSTRKSIAKALGYTGNVTELAMRIATVEHVINKLTKDKRNGKNNYSTKEIHQIAVAKSRATMDFSKGGLATKKIDQFVPYLNAATQGFRVSRKYLSTAKGRMNFANKWAQASVGIAMLTFYNMLMSESDEDDTLMDDIAEHIKDNNHVFIHPFQQRDEEGRVNYTKIRKAPQLAPFFNLSESIARAIYYRMKGMDDPKKGESIKKQFTRASEQIGNLLPFVPTGSGLIGKMPPTISAGIKYIANYDPFRQMNIVSEGEFQKVLPSREGLYDDRVPVFLKAFGEATGFSPKRSQAVVESYVTSPTTNFLVGGAYAILDQAANTISDYNGAKQSKYSDGLFKTLFGKKGEYGVMRGRLSRKTTPNWRSYSYDDSERIKKIEGAVNQEIRAMSGFYAEEYKEASTPEAKKEILSEMREFALGLEVPADRKRAMESFRDRATTDLSKLKNSREIFDIKYTRDPETAARLFDYYFNVPDLRTSEGVKKVNERLQYMRSNFGYKASSRFKNEIKKISKEKYKY